MKRVTQVAEEAVNISLKLKKVHRLPESVQDSFRQVIQKSGTWPVNSSVSMIGSKEKQLVFNYSVNDRLQTGRGVLTVGPKHEKGQTGVIKQTEVETIISRDMGVSTIKLIVNL